MNNQSERIRTALLRRADSAQPPKPAAEDAPGDTTTSSFSVSAENLEALLHSAQGRPGTEAARAADQAAISVSAEALQALLRPEEMAQVDAVLEHVGPGAEDHAAGYVETDSETGSAGREDVNAAEASVATEPMAPESEPLPDRPVDPRVDLGQHVEQRVERTLPLLAARDRERVEQPRFAPSARVVEPRVVPQPARPSVAPSVSRVAAPTPRPAAPLPAPVAESGPAGTNRTRTLVTVGAVFIVVLALTLYFVRGRRGAAPQAVASPPPLALQLAAESMGSGLVNVRWNPESALVGKAQSGRLVIKEGDQQPRTVALAQAELKTGHLLYQSPADHLEFRLETVEASGAETGETIVVQIPKTSATAAVPGAPATPALPGQIPVPGQAFRPGVAQTGVQTGAQPGVQAAPTTPSDAANAAAPKPQPRAFTLPTAQRRAEPARGSVLLDAPGAAPGATGVSLPSTGLPAPSLPGSFVAPPPPSQAAAPAQPRTGGDLQPASLIRKVAPVYPPLAKAARIQGAVRFSATVGKDGRLQNIQLLGGHSALVQAATEAVKQWVYRPTMLNGEPVEVVTQLEVNFTLNDTSR